MYCAFGPEDAPLKGIIGPEKVLEVAKERGKLKDGPERSLKAGPPLRDPYIMDPTFHDGTTRDLFLVPVHEDTMLVPVMSVRDEPLAVRLEPTTIQIPRGLYELLRQRSCRHRRGPRHRLVPLRSEPDHVAYLVDVSDHGDTARPIGFHRDPCFTTQGDHLKVEQVARIGTVNESWGRMGPCRSQQSAGLLPLPRCAPFGPKMFRGSADDVDVEVAGTFYSYTWFSMSPTGPTGPGGTMSFPLSTSILVLDATDPEGRGILRRRRIRGRDADGPKGPR